MAGDRIDLRIEWEGDVQAHVHFIIDNDEVVASEQDHLQGFNSITFSYSTSAAPIHVNEGSLWFPGATARKLVVKASINGGPPATVDIKKDDTKNQWSWRGAAP